MAKPNTSKKQQPLIEDEHEDRETPEEKEAALAREREAREEAEAEEEEKKEARRTFFSKLDMMEHLYQVNLQFRGLIDKEMREYETGREKLEKEFLEMKAKFEEQARRFGLSLKSLERAYHNPSDNPLSNASPIRKSSKEPDTQMVQDIKACFTKFDATTEARAMTAGAIAKALGKEAKDLKTSLDWMMEQNSVRKTGQARGTVYWMVSK